MFDTTSRLPTRDICVVAHMSFRKVDMEISSLVSPRRFDEVWREVRLIYALLRNAMQRQGWKIIYARSELGYGSRMDT